MYTKAKILVVEDETSVAMLMVYLLNRAGCDVQTAWNGEKALQLARTGNFDLITLDIDLPGTDGFRIYRRLKEDPSLCSTPVVFVSGRASADDRKYAFELGAVDYITKPFDVTDFIFRIISHAKVKNRRVSTSLVESAGYEKMKLI